MFRGGLFRSSPFEPGAADGVDDLIRHVQQLLLVHAHVLVEPLLDEADEAEGDEAQHVLQLLLRRAGIPSPDDAGAVAVDEFVALSVIVKV